MKKRAFITGLTGMVGSHLADYLIKNTDWHIYGLVRWNDKMDNIEHLMNRVTLKPVSTLHWKHWKQTF